MRSATSHAPPDEMPAENPFDRCQASRHRFGRRLAHVLHAIHAAAIEDLRQIRFRPLADARNARALFRLRADDLDLRVLFLQILRHAHDGAGRAHRRDEVRDAAFRLTPEFRARCLRSARADCPGFANWSRMMPLPSRCI